MTPAPVSAEGRLATGEWVFLVVIAILSVVGVVLGVLAWRAAPNGVAVIIEPRETDESAAVPLPVDRELLSNLGGTPNCSAGSAADEGLFAVMGSVYERSLFSVFEGYSATANCKWSFQLDGEWDVFSTLIGVSHVSPGGEGDGVKFVVRGDDKLLEQYVVSDLAPLEINLDVSGVESLELEVLNLSIDPLQAFWGTPRLFSYARP